MTIPIDPRFIPAFSIEDVLLDKDTGAPLSGGLVYFEQDNNRGLAKDVWQITGTSPNYTFVRLPNPMELSSIGTFMDALDNPVIPYFFPYDANGNVELYYIRVTSSADVEQFVRQAQPYVPTADDTELSSVIHNSLSNPQFAEILFDMSNGSYTYTVGAVSGFEINIAPDWDLVVTSPGGGSVTLTQVKPIGTLNVLTNPGTILQIASSGLSSILLRQRLYGSPNLWGSGFISSSFVAKTGGGTDLSLSLFYSQSDGATQNITLLTGVLPASGDYESFAGTKQIAPSTSSDNYPDAYIDIFFVIPASITVSITSVMVAFTGTASIANLAYDQESNARQVDHLFHYYRESAVRETKDSLLTGWDFGLNPWQFRAVAQSNLADNDYTADQTIVVQQLYVSGAVGNSISVGQAGVNQNYGFKVQSVIATNQFALIQYIDPASCRSSWGKAVSSMVRLNATKQNAGLPLRMKMRLIYRAGLPPTISQVEPIATWAAFGDPVLAAGWSAKLPNNDPIYNISNGENEFIFEEFVLPVSTDANMTLGIMLYTIDNMISTGTPDNIIFEEISLVQNQFAVEASKLTFDETLARCQYYYEKSYNYNIIPTPAGAPAAVAGALVNQLSGQMYLAVYNPGTGNMTQNVAIHNTNFTIRFNTTKRTSAPLVKLYSTTGTINTVLAQGFVNGALLLNTTLASTLWTTADNGNKGISFILVTPAAKLYDSMQTAAPAAIVDIYLDGYITYQYTSDARLGKVP